MCWCILGWQSVAYHFLGHYDLDLWPCFRTIVSRAFHLYYLSYGFQIWCAFVSWDDIVSCDKCVLGSLFFLYHKSITIKVSWAGQDLACTPETVEGSLFFETVLPLHWRSAMQYIATVSMPGRKPNHSLTMVSTLIASRWSRPQSQIRSSLCWLLMLVFSWAHRGSTWEILFNSNSLWAIFFVSPNHW